MDNMWTRTEIMSSSQTLKLVVIQEQLIFTICYWWTNWVNFGANLIVQWMGEYKQQ